MNNRQTFFQKLLLKCLRRILKYKPKLFLEIEQKILLIIFILFFEQKPNGYDAELRPIKSIALHNNDNK